MAAIIVVAPIVAGDAWGVVWLATGLARQLRSHAPWYEWALPASVAGFTWWVTVSLAIFMIRSARVRAREHRRYPGLREATAALRRSRTRLPASAAGTQDRLEAGCALVALAAVAGIAIFFLVIHR